MTNSIQQASSHRDTLLRAAGVVFGERTCRRQRQHGRDAVGRHALKVHQRPISREELDPCRVQTHIWAAPRIPTSLLLLHECQRLRCVARVCQLEESASPTDACIWLMIRSDSCVLHMQPLAACLPSRVSHNSSGDGCWQYLALRVACWSSMLLTSCMLNILHSAGRLCRQHAAAVAHHHA